jgi:hypothetical protein
MPPKMNPLGGSSGGPLGGLGNSLGGSSKKPNTLN